MMSWLVLASVVVGQQDPGCSPRAVGGVAGTVHHKSVQKFPTLVYIEDVGDRRFEPPAKRVQVDQKNKEFSPKVTPMVVATKLGGPVYGHQDGLHVRPILAPVAERVVPDDDRRTDFSFGGDRCRKERPPGVRT